ncbi:putative adhesin [Streptacidiphilus sp. PAMC 29251]
MNVPTVPGAPPISQSLAEAQGFGALCTAENCSTYDPKKAAADRSRAAAEAAAARAEEKARAAAEAKARAQAAAAHRHCSWYDAVCQVQVHAAAILEAALIVAAVAAVIVICVVAPEVAIAAAGAFGEAALGGATLEMAAVAGISAGVSTAATGAGLTTLAVGAGVVANLAGAESYAVGEGGGGGGLRGSKPGSNEPASVTEGGRGGGQAVAGHGFYYTADGKTKVPSGTYLHFYVNHGEKLDDSVGNAIEGGSRTIKPVETYGPGSSVPDYTIAPPAGLNILTGSTTVSEPTRLSTLLGNGSIGGVVHLCICREVAF